MSPGPIKEGEGVTNLFTKETISGVWKEDVRGRGGVSSSGPWTVVSKRRTNQIWHAPNPRRRIEGSGDLDGY
jgi:hypothetical protein